VTELEMPPGFAEIDAAANIIHDYEMHRTLAPEIAKARDLIDAALVARIERAGRWSTADYRRAQETVISQRITFHTFMQSWDGVLCLAAGGQAPRGLASTGDPMMNSSWTALHVPCGTLPALQGADNMPIGLQIVSAKHTDLKLLRIAAMLEKLLGLA
jgi:Asp-tRNA(Asn)/Glu-tRNA(Gln) amidotransferase A subunit family amidase